MKTIDFGPAGNFVREAARICQATEPRYWLNDEEYDQLIALAKRLGTRIYDRTARLVAEARRMGKRGEHVHLHVWQTFEDERTQIRERQEQHERERAQRKITNERRGKKREWTEDYE